MPGTGWALGADLWDYGNVQQNCLTQHSLPGGCSNLGLGSSQRTITECFFQINAVSDGLCVCRIYCHRNILAATLCPPAGLSQPAPAPPGSSAQHSKLSLKCDHIFLLEPLSRQSCSIWWCPSIRDGPQTAEGVQRIPGGEWGLRVGQRVRPLLISRMRSAGDTFIRGSAPLTAACLSPALGLYHLPLGWVVHGLRAIRFRRILQIL